MPLHPRICLLLLAGLAMAGEAISPPANPADGPISRGQRIYAVHHSFHEGNFYGILTGITRSAGIGDSAITGNHYIGGSTVSRHWSDAVTGKAAQAALTAGQVDVLTTTPIYLPDLGIEDFAQLGFTHNADFRMTVMEFWLPFDNYEPGNYRSGAQHVAPPRSVDHEVATGEGLRRIHAPYIAEMDGLVRGINAKLGRPVVLVVPVGQALIALRERIRAGQVPGLTSQGQLFTDSLGHPRPPLTVMMAYSHFAVIYRRSPVGLPAPRELGPDAEGLNRVLQDLAWDAVIHHPLSGVTAADH